MNHFTLPKLLLFSLFAEDKLKTFLTQNFRKHEKKMLPSSLTLEDDPHYLRVTEKSKQHEKGERILDRILEG